jgi:hypothetical protein
MQKKPNSLRHNIHCNVAMNSEFSVSTMPTTGFLLCSLEFLLTRWRCMRFAAGNHGARGKRRCGNITDEAGETILISPAAGQLSGCTGARICDFSFFSSLACVLKSWCGVCIKLVSASWTYWTWILRITSKESIVKADLVLEVAWWVRDGGGGKIAPATSWLQMEEKTYSEQRSNWQGILPCTGSFFWDLACPGACLLVGGHFKMVLQTFQLL